ncbi:MAG: mechanosensitive ion channel, partial [Clostridiales bacterium]|nr:mechanosensitive ion channel [Candidatus Blautia equi]
MQAFINSAADLCTQVGGKIVLAVLVFIIGRIIINKLVSVLNNSKIFEKADGEVKTFTMSFVKIGLTVILVISIINILGVPMASVVTVLASAGVAVGLALQGALSNLAGGIMLLFFRPFKVGDFIEASGAVGVVKELTLFYTVVTTVDNKSITVPNGSLMNANIINYSAEPLRRVDLTFGCGKGEDPEKVQNIMVDVMKKNPKVLSNPDAPFARLSGGSNEAMEFTVRAWVNGADYWTVYFDL